MAKKEARAVNDLDGAWALGPMDIGALFVVDAERDGFEPVRPEVRDAPDCSAE